MLAAGGLHVLQRLVDRLQGLRQLLACALLAFATSTPARAQETPTLHGPWVGAGIGTASASVNCDICIGDRNGGLSGYLAGGLRVAPAVHVGAELTGWFDNTDGVIGLARALTILVCAAGLG